MNRHQTEFRLESKYLENCDYSRYSVHMYNVLKINECKLRKLLKKKLVDCYQVQCRYLITVY